MDELQSLMHGFGVVLTPTNIALMFTGVILGVIIGVLPGLGGANGVAILLPLTFGMAQTPGGATSAIILLSCIYWGALFGGAITSILFNIPGEPWSVATTFDGYPLAQQGRAGTALTAAFTSSFVVAILLPLTFGMAQTPGGATSAIILLSCIYWGALFGGAITSILFNIPGEPWSVATTFDGYPLAQQGRAGTALTAAFTSSFVGAF